jgi:hypothetical protein
MSRSSWGIGLASAGLVVVSLLMGGCLNVKAPESISVDTGRRQPVDASQVPPTASHEEARQKLAEAYAEIRRLKDKVADLEKDKRELKAEREDCEKKMKRMKDKHGD